MKKFSLACLPFLLAASPASAAIYDFNITGGIIGRGTLTTEDTPVAPNGYLVTGITGIYDGNAITALLPPGTYPSSGPNDNLLYTNGLIFDFSGISFDAGGAQNLYGVPDDGEGSLPSNYIDFNSGSFVNVSISAVPEPGSWALMLLGFGGIGIAMGRRRATDFRLQAA